MMNKLILISLYTSFLAACATTKVADNLATIGVNYSWQEKHECSQISPQINLSGVPQETIEIKVSMRDLDSPNYPHGGGVIIYTGNNVIEEGALTKYKGPCPPTTHRYVIKVNAIDNDGVIVGEGKLMKKYTPQ